MGMINLALRSVFIRIASDYLHAVKTYYMQTPVLLTSQGRRSAEFYSA
jgi:hypothetical protein